MDISSWPELTPERISLLQVDECRSLLQSWPEYPLRLAQAAKCAHLGLQAALTASLAGSANIEVLTNKAKERWLAYFNDPSEEKRPPSDDYVLGFSDLLAKASAEEPGGWLQKPLEICDTDREYLSRLAYVRGCFEHPKPRSHYFEPAWLAPAIATATRQTVQCLAAVYHHLEPQEEARLERAAAMIAEICAKIK